jgi:hypothetical protein
MDDQKNDILFEEKRSIVFFVVCFAIAIPLAAIFSYGNGNTHFAILRFWDNPTLFFIASFLVLIGLALAGMSGKITVTPTQIIARTGRKEKIIAKADIVWALAPRNDGMYTRRMGNPRARYEAPTGSKIVRVELQPALPFLDVFGPFLMKSVLLGRKDGTYVLIPTKRPADLLVALGAPTKPTF